MIPFILGTHSKNNLVKVILWFIAVLLDYRVKMIPKLYLYVVHWQPLYDRLDRVFTSNNGGFLLSNSFERPHLFVVNKLPSPFCLPTEHEKRIELAEVLPKWILKPRCQWAILSIIGVGIVLVLCLLCRENP